MSYLQKIMFPKKQKKILVKLFNMITNNNKSKAMVEYISCDSKCKFNSTTCNSNKKWDNKTCHCKCKKEYSWDPCICEDSKYLKSVIDDSVIACNEIICYGYCINNNHKWNKYCVNNLP